MNDNNDVTIASIIYILFTKK